MIQPKNTSLYRVAEYLASIENRFRNMAKANIDVDGYPRFQQAMKHYEERGKFTVGHLVYLFNRTSPLGVYSDYNTHRGYNKKYGEMLRCPLKDIVDAGVIDWPSGQNGVMTGPLSKAIQAETKWHWTRGNLYPQHNTTFDQLFGDDDE